MEEERARLGDRGIRGIRLEVDTRGVYVHIRDGGVHDDGGVDLQQAALAEKPACLGEQPCTALEHGPRCRRVPAHRLAPDELRSRASGCPNLTGAPACAVTFQSAAPGGNSTMTVEPMLKRPSSAPLL